MYQAIVPGQLTALPEQEAVMWAWQFQPAPSKQLQPAPVIQGCPILLREIYPGSAGTVPPEGREVAEAYIISKEKMTSI